MKNRRGKNCQDGKVCMQLCSMLAMPAMDSVVLLVGIWVSSSTTWGPAGVPHPLLTTSIYIFFISSLLCRAP